MATHRTKDPRVTGSRASPAEIERARLQLGWSYWELSTKSGLHITTVLRLKHPSSRFSSKTIAALQIALDDAMRTCVGGARPSDEG